MDKIHETDLSIYQHIQFERSHFINTFLAKSVYLSYLPCIKKFGLPPSASCPVHRNVRNKECLPLVSVSKGRTSLFMFRMAFTFNYLEKGRVSRPRFSVYHQKWVYTSAEPYVQLFHELIQMLLISLEEAIRQEDMDFTLKGLTSLCIERTNTSLHWQD